MLQTLTAKSYYFQYTEIYSFTFKIELMQHAHVACLKNVKEESKNFGTMSVP